MEYNCLFHPLKTRTLSLKNRICMTAIHLNYCAETQGRPSEQFKRFYYARAEGGAGLITVGGCRFAPEGAVGLGFISLEDDSYIEPWQVFTTEMHRRGAKVAVQLYHAGRYSRQSRMPDGMTALAPSAIYCGYTRETPREMTTEDIHRVIGLAAAAAARAKQAGFDAVELLGSAGYLINQFLSPLTNRREDGYGGSFEGRCRFPRELLEAVRRAVGPDYPIIVRMSGNDFVPGSNTNEDAVEIARCYETWGADLLSVTGGWHETRVPQLPGEVPHGAFAYLARTIKQAVHIPVIAANRIQDPLLAEELLATGQADCVGMCRTLLADPQWPNKTRNHQEKLLRRCVGCNQGCLSATFFNKPVRCLVNGLCGREGEFASAPKAAAKKLLVVGGGPAGMEFALRAAERGHKVTLWEQGERLGGQLALACIPPGKEDFAGLIGCYEAALEQAGVAVRLHQRADASAILAAGFDQVILATGAIPRNIPLDNPGNVPVMTAFDVLGGHAVPGRRVVVLGGGAVGCETAQLLARKGAIDSKELFFLTIHHAETPERISQLLNQSWRQVSVVEVTDKAGSGFDAGCAWPVMKDLKRLGVKLYTNARLLSTGPSRAIIACQDENSAQTRMELPCDTIILSVGALPQQQLYEQLKDSGLTIHLLGDCRKVGRIIDAVNDAIELAAHI